MHVWSTVGRAGFILDNLIAARNATPMIAVMPAGHTSRAQANVAGRSATEAGIRTIAVPQVAFAFRRKNPT